MDPFWVEKRKDMKNSYVHDDNDDDDDDEMLTGRKQNVNFLSYKRKILSYPHQIFKPFSFAYKI